jgi:hypothetical protein
MTATKPSPRPQLFGRCRTWGLLGLLMALLVVAGVAARYEPPFYADLPTTVAQGSDPEAIAAARQRASGRFLTKVSAFLADIREPGTWATVVADDELNAWRAEDVPRSHPDLLPAGLHDVRVRFLPGTLLVGCQTGVGPLAGLGWAELQVKLLEANRVAIAVKRCRLGAIPLPAGLATAQLARGLETAGLPCEMLRLDGQPHLVAQLPPVKMVSQGEQSTSCWLDGLSFQEGEAFLTGMTRLDRGAGR